MRSETSHSRNPRREGGAALFVSVMMLVLLGLLGLASLETVSRDRQAAGFQNRARMALWAAEAALAQARSVLFTADLPSGIANLVDFHPALPGGALGDGALYPYGQPAYGPDPDVVNPIDWLGSGGACDDWVMSIEQAGSQNNAIWRETLWDLRVQGTATGGAVSRIEATGTRCYAFN